MVLDKRYLIALSALLLLGISCSEDEEPPHASIRVVHSIVDFGEVEVRIDNESVTTIDFGTISKAVKVSPGSHTIGVANPGAPQSFYQIPLDLRAQGYFVAISGQAIGGELNATIVDAIPPEVPSGNTAIEVLNLVEGNFMFDVYVGFTPVAEGIAYKEVTPFATALSGPKTIAVFNAGSDPTNTLPLIEENLELEDGSAALVVIQPGDPLSLTIVDVL